MAILKLNRNDIVVKEMLNAAIETINLHGKVKAQFSQFSILSRG